MAKYWLLCAALGLGACSSDEGDDLGGGDASSLDLGSPDAGDAGDAVDGGSDPDAGFDNPLCRFGGRGEQAPGEACGCAADCSGDSAFCARDPFDLLGDGFCTETCSRTDPCPEQFECLELGPLSFCQPCAGGEPGGVDDDCVCDSDCGSVELGDQTRQLECVAGSCAITGCIPTTAIGCPDGQFCELNGVDPVCVTCLSDVPGGAGDPCGCQRDCGGSSLECRDGTCERLCASAEDCDPGQECRVTALGNSICSTPAPTCTETSTRTLGSPCTCNADCAASAPVCLTSDFLGDVDLGFCTQRPCSTTDPDACASDGPISFSCCRVPLVFPPTCLPDPLAEQLGSFLTCN